jgi:AhpC/TSA family
MAATLIYGDRASQVASALEAGDELWISEQDLTASTGWERKPQGLCFGDRCVPIPPSRESEFIASDGRVNIAAFSRYLDQPVVRDEAASVWLVGESAAERTGALRSLEAPDFRLPDLDGNIHALSDYRGKKVLLLSWASW